MSDKEYLINEYIFFNNLLSIEKKYTDNKTLDYIRKQLKQIKTKIFKE